jgi:hypothetical protein
MLQCLYLLFLLTFQRVKERNVVANLGKKAMDKMSVVEQLMEMNIEGVKLRHFQILSHNSNINEQ